MVIRSSVWVAAGAGSVGTHEYRRHVDRRCQGDLGVVGKCCGPACHRLRPDRECLIGESTPVR